MNNTTEQFLKVDYNLFRLIGEHNGVNIGCSEIMLLALIQNLSCNKKMQYPTCAASNEYLADTLNIPVTTLRNYLRRLKQLCLIKTFESREKGSKLTTLRLIYVQQDQIEALSNPGHTLEAVSESGQSLEVSSVQNDTKQCPTLDEALSNIERSSVQNWTPNKNINRTVKEHDYINESETASRPVEENDKLDYSSDIQVLVQELQTAYNLTAKGNKAYIIKAVTNTLNREKIKISELSNIYHEIQDKVEGYIKKKEIEGIGIIGYILKCCINEIKSEAVQEKTPDQLWRETLDCLLEERYGMDMSSLPADDPIRKFLVTHPASAQRWHGWLKSSEGRGLSYRSLLHDLNVAWDLNH